MDPQHPEAILQRLEELRRWQQEQQDALQQKQIAQRDLLNMEQQKLYEMFGLSMSSCGSNSVTLAERTTATGTGDFDESHQELVRNLEENFNAQSNCKSPTKYDDIEKDVTIVDNILKTRVSTVSQTAKPHSVPPEQANIDAMPKRKFLKRGEGLSSRFGVHPDELRLGNLPKYKYAGAHRHSRFFKNAVQKIHVKPGAPPRVPWTGCLSINEDADDGGNDEDLGVQPLKNLRNISKGRVSVAKPPEPRTWATSLAASASNPTLGQGTERSNLSMQSTPMREKIRQQQAEIDELYDFERVEEDQQSTVNILDDGEETENAVVPDQNRSPVQRNDDENNNDDDDDDDNEFDQPRRPLQVRFHQQVLVNPAHQNVESDSDTIQSTDLDNMSATDKTSTPTMQSAFRAFKAKLFRTQSTTSNPHNMNESTITVDNNADDSVTPTSIAFTTKAASKQQPAPHPLPTTVFDQTANLKEKLAQLEHEIALFRSQNAALTAVAQQHQLDRIALAEERAEHEARLADERARFEVQMHDERIRLKDEREALERRARELRGPNRKEREETAALRERVELLEREAANKEQRHVSAQARLRAQLRTMEKDLKEFSFEVDQQRKENKKLEAENVRLRRQSNSKMLNEINRNIAKLAVVPAQTTNAAESDKNNASAKDKQMSRSSSLSQQRSNKSSKTDGSTGLLRTAVVSTRSRTRSVPNLMQNVAPETSSTDSESEIDETEQSNYFQPAVRSRSRSRDNMNNVQIQTDSAPPRNTAESPPTAAATNSKREIVNADGSRDILYPNGNLKKVSADSMRVRMLYFNKDIKETDVAAGTVKYYYAETNTWQTSYLDGLEILEFPNGQIEHRHRDGRIEVHFPNGSQRLSDPGNGAVLEEWRYADGTRAEQRRNGERVLMLANGQREVHTAQHKRREYPDGTVKLVYPDGSQETRYSNGRVRLKDKDGKLLMDSESLFAASAPLQAIAR